MNVTMNVTNNVLEYQLLLGFQSDILAELLAAAEEDGGGETDRNLQSNLDHLERQ